MNRNVFVMTGFLEFCFIKKYFLLFFTDFSDILMFHNNIVNISGPLNKWNLLKTCIQSNFPADFYIFCSHFYYGKK